MVKFDWDDGNRDKNRRHGVLDSEIEEALQDTSRRQLRTVRFDGELRLMVLGRASSSGKYLRVVYTPRRRGEQVRWRPISAVEMSPGERRLYRRGRG